MAKRKLNRRQEWRVRKIQEDRLARAERKQQGLAQPHGEDLGPELHGRIVASFGAEFDIEDPDKTLFRCVCRQNIDSLVCGDEVVWQQESTGNGVIIARRERRTLLSRPDFHQKLKPVAANVDQIAVVSAIKPGVNFELIDRYLVAAETVNIPPMLVLNKIDLLSRTQLQQLTQDLTPYQQIGYTVLYISTKVDTDLGELIACLQGKTSIFVGQSGVGKSSILQRLLPEENLQVGELSASSGLGRHTTTVTRLYHFPQGGELIDSPGVRDFALWNITAQQAQWGFIEFRPYLQHCRFNDCSHTVEPGCAVINAAQQGSIQPRRLASYQQILASVKSSWTKETD